MAPLRLCADAAEAVAASDGRQQRRAADEMPPPPQPGSFKVEMRALEDYRSFAALTIQRFWRGGRVRLKMRRQVRSKRVFDRGLQ